MASYQPAKADKFTFGLWTVGNRGRDPFGALCGRRCAHIKKIARRPTVEL